MSAHGRRQAVRVTMTALAALVVITRSTLHAAWWPDLSDVGAAFTCAAGLWFTWRAHWQREKEPRHARSRWLQSQVLALQMHRMASRIDALEIKHQVQDVKLGNLLREIGEACYAAGLPVPGMEDTQPQRSLQLLPGGMEEAG